MKIKKLLTLVALLTVATPVHAALTQAAADTGASWFARNVISKLPSFDNAWQRSQDFGATCVRTFWDGHKWITDNPKTAAVIGAGVATAAGLGYLAHRTYNTLERQAQRAIDRKDDIALFNIIKPSIETMTKSEFDAFLEKIYTQVVASKQQESFPSIISLYLAHNTVTQEDLPVIQKLEQNAKQNMNETMFNQFTEIRSVLAMRHLPNTVQQAIEDLDLNAFIATFNIAEKLLNDNHFNELTKEADKDIITAYTKQTADETAIRNKAERGLLHEDIQDNKTRLATLNQMLTFNWKQPVLRAIDHKDESALLDTIEQTAQTNIQLTTYEPPYRLQHLYNPELIFYNFITFVTTELSEHSESFPNALFESFAKRAISALNLQNRDYLPSLKLFTETFEQAEKALTTEQFTQLIKDLQRKIIYEFQDRKNPKRDAFKEFKNHIDTLAEKYNISKIYKIADLRALFMQ